MVWIIPINNVDLQLYSKLNTNKDTKKYLKFKTRSYDKARVSGNDRTDG